MMISFIEELDIIEKNTLHHFSSSLRDHDRP
jgi:hypothetical protein